MRSAGADRTRRVVRRLAIASAVGLVLAVAPLPWFSWITVSVTDRIDLPLAAADTTGTRTADDTGIDQFTMIGISTEHVIDAPIAVRVSEDGRWGEWFDVTVDDTDGPDPETAEGRATRPASDGVWVGAADGYEVKVPDAAGTAQVLLVRDEIRSASVDDVTVDAGASVGPAINPRSAWGARAAKNAPSYGSEMKLAIVHHSATSNDYTSAQVPSILRSIQAYHMDGRGWSDIAYNLVVDKFGTIWEGRGGGVDRLVIGAHAMGFNTNTVGVMMLGEYSSAQPTAAAIDAMGRVIGWKSFVHGVDPASTGVPFTSGGSGTWPAGTTGSFPRIVGHRDVGSTACPGSNLYRLMNNIRSVAKVNSDGLLRDTTPFGSVDVRQGGAGTVQVAGWAIDPDAPGGTGQVRVSLPDRSQVADATVVRSDVGAVYPAFGSAHGFDVTIRGVPAGTRNLCVSFLNPGPGIDVDAGCQNVIVTPPTTGSPVGAITGVSTTIGTAVVTGFAVDPDSVGPISVQVALAGQTQTVVADVSVAGLGSTYTGLGDLHGFTATFTGVVGDGLQACATARNSGPGADQAIGCFSVVTPGGPPTGALEDVARSGTTLSARGWADDPDTDSPISVVMTVDGIPFATGVADRPRADSTESAGVTDVNGFALSGEWNPSPGAKRVCVRAVNVGRGSDLELPSCRTIDVPAPPPPPVSVALGGADRIQPLRRAMRITGWAIDSVQTGPVWVWLIIDGQWRFVRADQNRPFFSFFFKAWGDAHGFNVTVPARRGIRRVCMASFTVNIKKLAFLGCQQVRVR